MQAAGGSSGIWLTPRTGQRVTQWAELLVDPAAERTSIQPSSQREKRLLLAVKTGILNLYVPHHREISLFLSSKGPWLFLSSPWAILHCPRIATQLSLRQTIISRFNLIFITPQSYFNQTCYCSVTHTVLKAAISSVNIVLRAIMEGNRCHNYALTKHISHLSALAVCQDLCMQLY